eukprot:2930973-Pyramimonas_sp.AAC.1
MGSDGGYLIRVCSRLHTVVPGPRGKNCRPGQSVVGNNIADTPIKRTKLSSWGWAFWPSDSLSAI